MKTILTSILIILCLSAFGQKAQLHLKAGIEKHNALNYKAAIKEYDQAILADKNLTEAYFNRGACEMELKDLKSAMRDFNKSIELDPAFVRAYYSRASVFANEKKYTEALLDLDKTIALDQAFPNALTLRGQIRVQTGNAAGGCEDFNKAKEIGDNLAEKYIMIYCADAGTIESFVLEWPANEKWKLGSNQENDQMHVIEVIHSNETLEKWSEIGTMTTIKNVKNVPMDKAMDLTYQQSKQNAPNAKLTFIEKDETAEYPWITFTIESPEFTNDKTPESQLWYIVQGKNALYTNFRAVKQATIPAELKDKWIAFFKAGKIVNE
jgi:tetratricopeptide (TPR) repeat protein